jgi:glycosyltransferase involved in cell wall biosynthesis
MIKKVVYVGAFRFPNGDAASQRVLGIGKSLREYGFDVIFCGWEQEPRKEDMCNNIYTYDGFTYYSQRELDIQSSNKLEKLYNYITKGRKTLKWIRKYKTNNEINYIIVYNSNVYFLILLYIYCRSNKIKLIADCTEWYQGSHLPGGRYGMANLDNNIRIKYIYPLIKNIILISSFLEKIYSERKGKTLVIPPLIDINHSKWNVKSDLSDFSTKIKIIYAGDPGKKDLLNVFFLAASKFNQRERKKIEIHLVGIDYYKLSSFFFNKGDVPNYIKCHGRVPLKDIPIYYSMANFSFLIRENLHYANAGFPTKVVESLACGIPVITNITSDLGKYIQDDVNGFFLDNPSEENVLYCFKRIANIDIQKHINMQREAKRTASNYFHFENYSNLIGEYLRLIK